MSRLNDQVSFRVTTKERRLLDRAARLSARTLSEWARLVILIEAQIQIESKGTTYPPSITLSPSAAHASSRVGIVKEMKV